MSGYQIIGQDPDLIAGWNMGQSPAGIVQDAGPGGFAGSIVGNPMQGRDKFGSFLECDGGADSFEGGSIGTIKTVLMWIDPDSNTEALADFDGGTHTIEITAGTLTAAGFTSPTFHVDGVPGATVVAGKRQMIVVTTDTGFTASAVEAGLLDGKQYPLAAYGTTKEASWVAQEYKRALIYF